MPRMGLPLGAVALILSLGIYQSYFPVAAVLMVGALLFDTLDGELSLGRLFLRGVKMVLTLGVAIAAYMVIARWVMRNAGGLTDYMGISEMGHLSLGELPSLIVKCYQEYGSYFWNNGTGQLFTLAADRCGAGDGGGFAVDARCAQGCRPGACAFGDGAGCALSAGG